MGLLFYLFVFGLFWVVVFVFLDFVLDDVFFDFFYEFYFVVCIRNLVWIFSIIYVNNNELWIVVFYWIFFIGWNVVGVCV